MMADAYEFKDDEALREELQRKEYRVRSADYWLSFYLGEKLNSYIKKTEHEAPSFEWCLKLARFYVRMNSANADSYIKWFSNWIQGQFVNRTALTTESLYFCQREWIKLFKSVDKRAKGSPKYENQMFVAMLYYANEVNSNYVRKTQPPAGCNYKKELPEEEITTLQSVFTKDLVNFAEEKGFKIRERKTNSFESALDGGLKKLKKLRQSFEKYRASKI